MELKDLSREIVLAEALAERGKMVMELNTMVGNLQREFQRLQEKVKELEATALRQTHDDRKEG